MTRPPSARIKRSLVAVIAGVGACGALVYAIKRMHHSLHLLQQTQNELPIGLPNPKNLCYLNALLQAMAANPTLVRFLQRSALIRRNKLLLCLVCLLKGLRCSSRYLVSHDLDVTLTVIHGELLRELTVVHHWDTREQQDAHELFNFFMDLACFRELGYTATKAADGLTSVSQFTGQRFETVVPNCYHRFRLANGVKPYSLVLQSPLRTEVFQRHLIVTQVTCSRCEYRSSPVLQPEACITLFVDPSQNETSQQSKAKSRSTKASPCPSTLGSCLRKQFRVSECLPDMYCPKCQSDITPSSASPPASGYCQRNQWIANLPSCLVIHVQRGRWQNYPKPASFPLPYDTAGNSISFGSGTKCTDYLVFPYKLDMNGYTLKTPVSREPDSGDCPFTDGERDVQGSAPPKLYLLRAILVHQGNSINSGHYITYRAWTKPDPASHSRREYSLVHVLRRMFMSVSDYFQGLPYTTTRPVSSPWILASDSRVVRVAVDEVRECIAYLLFYERTTSYNLIAGRQANRHRLTSTECSPEYADWEQADGGASASPYFEAAAARSLEDADDETGGAGCGGLDDAEDYEDGDEESDGVNDGSGDFLIATGSRADVIKSLALAISQM